ncbi:hypothetical protein RUM43_005204 [Polyplax serrata]|uniref:Regulation of nuclear pre-mRNA domain-containing protein 2 n=1 Tax=Polyplax serrata TaxID=468196 RepID=A0AAN8SCQ2_POLSC
MAATIFNEQQFENKLVNLKDSQESINTLSSWCLQNRDHHKKIVNCWLHCLKRVKIEQRLSLFYLANDVIQYSKRKHYQFVESWGTALQKATTLVRDDKVKSRIMRIFKIWDERGVYDEAFISDLCGLLTTNVKKKTDTNLDSSEFQSSILIAKIHECKLLASDTDIRFKKVKENSLHLTDADNMLHSLKDRRHGSDVVAEVDAGVKKMEAYVKALELEIAEREKLIDFLHQATLFYESQRGEAKIVSNAYRNFGNKVKLLKRKLDDLMPTLSDSPIPSPDVNAPSPSPDSDFELSNGNNRLKIQNSESKAPSSENNGLNLSFINSTFMGNSQFSDINLQRDVFNDNTHSVPISKPDFSSSSNSTFQSEGTVRPIEVINTREQKEDVSFNITDFLKSLLPGGVTKVGDRLDAHRTNVQNMEPLQPPPIPPIFTTSDPFSVNWKSDWGQTDGTDVGNWNHEPPPQNWNVPGQVQDSWIDQRQSTLTTDTPESPPLYEKKGISQPLEYDDSLPAASLLDVDHRTLLPISELRDMDHRIEVSHRIDVDHRKLTKLGPKDVDHRNLISLTGSPRNETKPLPPPPAFVWPEDQDYRCKLSDTDFRVPHRANDFSDVLNSNFNMSNKVSSVEVGERKDVNVESIDMDVSEEDEEESSGLIQLEEETDERNIEQINSPFLNQSNLRSLNMTSSFMENVGSIVHPNEDVDERLKSIFGGVIQNAGAKLIPTEESTSVSAEVQLGHIQTEIRKDNSGCEIEGQDPPVEPNGFENDYFRRETMWQAEGQADQLLLPCPSNVGLRGMNFAGRMGRNTQRPLRGRGAQQHRFFRPHHPRPEMMRGRMPFRPRLPPPVRGGRW